jgi:hypothetical protein
MVRSESFQEQAEKRADAECAEDICTPMKLFKEMLAGGVPVCKQLAWVMQSN